MTISATELTQSASKPLQEEEAFIIQRSPFVFLRRVAYWQIAIALTGILLSLTQPEQVNESLRSLNTITWHLLTIGLFTAVQVLIITLLFALWRGEQYDVNLQRILWRRGGLFEAQTLLATQKIVGIELKQSWLGRQLDYGSLRLTVQDEREHGRVHHPHLRDIPTPHRYQQKLDNLILRPQQSEPIPPPQTIPALIAHGEDQYTEFKASLMWDYQAQRVNKELYLPVMKNVAAFMNSSGGKILIGVADDGTILGLANDYSTMRKGNADGYENTFNIAFSNMIGPEFRPYLTLSFPQLEGKEICLVTVRPSAYPVFLNNKGNEQFYIRTGNSSQPLTISQATKYIRSRFLA
jgi:membrane protein YdbS with pleckstrin-like domain